MDKNMGDIVTNNTLLWLLDNDDSLLIAHGRLDRSSLYIVFASIVLLIKNRLELQSACKVMNVSEDFFKSVM